ncbi:MAG: HIG1 domain-containing protein [Gammaproteobacteria bacterium]|nr:HIG1 domain-containing protein [Gammaproteobacteria bacterium]
MTLNIIIILALLATISTLGLGLLSMAIGGSTDKEFGERIMWSRIIIQGAAVVLILLALYLANT